MDLLKTNTIRIALFVGVLLASCIIVYRLSNQGVFLEPSRPLVSCKAFTGEECKGYLGRDVVSAGYKVILISIANRTNKYFILSQSDISLKVVPADVAVQSVYSNTTGHMVGWGIGSLFCPILLIPGIALSAVCYEENRKLTNDFIEKSLGERTIAPNDTIDGVVFVPIAHFKDVFTLVITDKDTQEKIRYEMNCKQGV